MLPLQELPAVNTICTTLSETDLIPMHGTQSVQSTDRKWDLKSLFIEEKKAIFSGFTDENCDRNMLKNSSEADELRMCSVTLAQGINNNKLRTRGKTPSMDY